jgi:hypothetical protein
MAEDTNTAGGVPAAGKSGGGDGISKLFDKIKERINALFASRRNADEKLDKKKKQYNDFKTKFLEFLFDLLLILGLVEVFVRDINDFLSKGKKYEPKFKKTLIDCFNANIACNLDDVIKPNQAYDPSLNPGANPYFIINVSKLDFFGLLKIDPNSTGGNIFYGSPSDNTLNRAIKTAIDSGQRQNWSDILWIEYDPNTNYVLFYVNYSYRNKPVNALVTDLVNKIDLIPNFSMLLNLFDNMYGSFSYSIQPTRIDPLSLINRNTLNKYIEKILDGGEDLLIDDSFFNFGNEELFDIERISLNQSKNFLEIKSCNNAESVVTPNDLYPILEQIISAGTFNERVQIIEAGMSTLETVAARNVTRLDLPKFKVEFYFNIFKEIINTLVTFVYSPQFLTIMMIYFKLANSNPNSQEPLDYEDMKDFLKKTRNILVCIVWSYFKLLLLLIIVPIILKKLITEANKERYERNKEKYELFVAQYLALRGLLDIVKNNELLRQITSAV